MKYDTKTWIEISSVLFIILLINLNAFFKIDYIFMIASLVLLLATLYYHSFNLVPFFLCLFLLKIYILFPSAIWQFPGMIFLLPFVISSLLILPFPQTRNSLSWFKKGKIKNLDFLLMIITALIAVIALIIWGFWSDNLGVEAELMKRLLVYPRWLVLIFAIPFFALINAFAEETIYRGVIQQALINVLNNRYVLIVMLQASAFAAAHVAFGFPNGKVGYLMTFGYACVLGYLRIRTKGILAPYITHVLADLVIGYFLYFMLLQSNIV